MMALIAMLTSVTGCQLLIDNRSRESGAVVVVPSDEWDQMRQASLAMSDTTGADQDPIADAPPPIVRIEASPGSETIKFSNYTGASLGGCTMLGVIELQHKGTLADTMTLLRNEAFRLNSNLLVPTRMTSEQMRVAGTPDKTTEKITIEARMMTCPLRLARGN